MLIAKLFQTSFDNMELMPTEQKHWAVMLPIYRNLSNLLFVHLFSISSS